MKKDILILTGGVAFFALIVGALLMYLVWADTISAGITIQNICEAAPELIPAAHVNCK